MLNSDAPSAAEIITGYITLLFHSTVSVATGEVSLEVIDKAIEHGGYILAVEGSIPEAMPEACKLGEVPLENRLIKAAKNATAVVAVGACAAFGGIPAAEGNSTGAMDVPEFLKKKGVSTPVIRIPGCPSHPDWIVGTLVHVIKFGLPALDRLQRPKVFFGEILHDQCPRFDDYERENFATTFGEDGCFFRLGCVGPNTHSDCSLRLWNSGTNFCINAGMPCTGCASPEYARHKNFPIYTKKRAKGGEGEHF
jgi:hydrogenase small subunit